MKLIIPAPMTLLEALGQISPQSSKNSLREWLRDGRVSIDERPEKDGRTLLHPGQIVTVGPRKKYIEGGLQVLYEDGDLVVIDKPEGLLSVSTAFEKEETVHAILKQEYHPRVVYVVHRLDQETSGVMVFALTERARNGLKDLFEKHDIERSYTAVVEGLVTESSGTWSHLLYEDSNYVVHCTDDPSIGRSAITHFKLKDRSKSFSWLELTLETGKKNQIRVQCKEAGHPISGDKKYGGKTSPIRRLCLHAHLLAFSHPVTKKIMRFVSPVPEAFYRMFKKSW